MRSTLPSIIALLSCFAFLSSCDSAIEDSNTIPAFDPGGETWEFDPNSAEYADVTFVSTLGGWGQGRARHARLSRDGVLTRSQFHGVPRIAASLSASEHDSLMALLYTPMALPADSTPGCADAPYYGVEFSNRFYSDSFWSSCGLYESEDWPERFKNRLKFFSAFVDVYDRIVAEHAPWNGLATTIEISQKEVEYGRPFTISLLVVNPTDSARTAFFHRSPDIDLVFSYKGRNARLSGSWYCPTRSTIGYEDSCEAPALYVQPRSSARKSVTIRVSELDLNIPQNSSDTLTIWAMPNLYSDYWSRQELKIVVNR